MECMFPPELSTAQLLMYLDEVADPDIASHVEQCDYCRNRAEDVDRLQKGLVANLYRIDCPASDVLGDFHFGVLAATEAQSLREHLSICPHCKKDLAHIQSLEAGRQRGPMQPRAGGLNLQLGKLLTGQMLSQPAALGIRGDDTGSQSKSVIYATERARITLDVNLLPGQDDAHQLVGTIIGKDLPPLVAYIWADDRLVDSAVVDLERGTFALQPLKAGTYELSILGGDLEFRIEDLSL